ncbi:MAG: slipin family protein [bacterium]
MAAVIGVFFSAGALLFVPVLIILASCIKQIEQYERGVRFSFGKFSGIMNPGWRFVFPIIQTYRKVDMRIKTGDVPDQEIITKDNIPVNIKAVIYYRVIDAGKSIIEVESFTYAVIQLAQVIMRNVIGQVELDQLLGHLETISQKIQTMVDERTEAWGVDVQSVELKDISLPDNMKRTIAKQAEAEREKRAVIINAEGEKIAAENLAAAAQMLGSTPGALHLRTLTAINDISSDDTNTVVFCIPLEVLRALEGLNKFLEKKSE